MRDYVDGEWFAHHMLEATTRESYRYLLDRSMSEIDVVAVAAALADRNQLVALRCDGVVL